MTSRVLDLATIAHALNALRGTAIGDAKWIEINDQQRVFLAWFEEHRDEVDTLSDVKALASKSFAELNRFLTDNRFDPMFDEFDGIGVVSILDMLMEWVSEGRATRILRMEADGGKDFYGRKIPKEVAYPAFAVRDADVYEAGYEHPLVRLRTKTGHSLWLMKAGEPPSGLTLNTAANLVLQAKRTHHYGWDGAIVPMLEMDTDGDIDWLLGMQNTADYFIQSVFQKFKLRANEKGARVKVATGMVVCMAAAGPSTPPYIVDDPFIGFFTQPGHDNLPLAAFWADTDSWKTSGGSLEDL